MKAKAVMTPHVITVTPGATVREIASLLLQHRISAVPVVDKAGKIVGIVSEGDLFRRPETGTANRTGSTWLNLIRGDDRLAQDYIKTHGRKAADVMTSKVMTVTEDTSVNEIAHLLETQHIKRVPVVRDGKPVGIVSRANLVQGLATQREPLIGIEPGDEGIRTKLVAELEKEGCANLTTTNVLVKDGVVEFWGFVASDAVRKASCLAAENIPGVKRVVDHRGAMPLQSWS